MTTYSDLMRERIRLMDCLRKGTEEYDQAKARQDLVRIRTPRMPIKGRDGRPAYDGVSVLLGLVG